MTNRLPESFVTEGQAPGTARDQVLSQWDRDVRQWSGVVEKLVREYPTACLATAFFVGASLAWWIKRR
jgi:hypothetical protein